MKRTMLLSIHKHVIYYLLCYLSISPSYSKPLSDDVYTKDLLMPNVSPEQNDSYICTAFPLNITTEEWVVRYDPLASANIAHHMLLFGCSGVQEDVLKLGSWDCGHHGVCQGSRIMYAWAKNAPPTVLPKDVGFHIGGQTGIKYLTLQIHYAKPLAKGHTDSSGLRLSLTHKQQKYMAGIYLLASGFADIPPFTEKTSVDMNCALSESGEPTDIFLFAYRVHAHKLGSVISGYLYDRKTKELMEIAKGNPQWPQAFYPTKDIYKVAVNDILHARCTWNSTTRSTRTYIGSTSGDEMCNLYLMYYTDVKTGSETGGCGSELHPAITAILPDDSDEPLPPNPLLEVQTVGENKNKDKEYTYGNLPNDVSIQVTKKGHGLTKQPSSTQSSFPIHPQKISYGSYSPETYDTISSAPSNTQEQIPTSLKKENPGIYDHSQNLVAKQREPKTSSNLEYHLVEGWGPKDFTLGQVASVAIDSNNDVVIFHRGSRSFDGSTFNQQKVLNDKTPIDVPTLLHLNRKTGEVMHSWGANFFYLPHGVTIDGEGNMWLVDTGMHQVFKFAGDFGDGKPLLTLGTKFEPGSDNKHFCMPTSVAVMKNGEFFVGDGYCNSRVIKYSAQGEVLMQFGASSSLSGSPVTGTFNNVHSITLANEENDVCVADRENGRVQCFSTSDGKFIKVFKFDEWGTRLFAVAYTPGFGGKLFAVNGPYMFFPKKVQLFDVDYKNGNIVSTVSPYNKGLNNPHDIAATKEGGEVYVVEIGPNKVWKFALGVTKTTTTTTASPFSLSGFISYILN